MNQIMSLVKLCCVISATRLCYSFRVQRARSLEAKQQREVAILDAARELATARSVREVTLTDVAAAVGMHKSAMLRYFETREQIFLALTAEAWAEWSAWLRENVVGGSSPDGTLWPRENVVGGSSSDANPAVPPAGDTLSAGRGENQTPAAVIARSLAARPFFCDLLGQAPMN